MTTPETPLDLDALAALEKAATPGPWKADTDTRGDCVLWGPNGQFVANAESEPHWLPAADGGKRAVMFDVDRRDVELIAAVRNQLPALLSALAAARAELEQTEADLDEVCGERNDFKRDLDAQTKAAFDNQAEANGLREELAAVTAERDEERRLRVSAATVANEMIEHAKRQRDEAREQAKQAQAELRDAKLTIAARDAALDASTETHRIAQQIVAATLGATPTAAPKADEPLYVDFSWAGNGAEQFAELFSDPDRPLFRLDVERMREFVGMAADTLDFLDECRLGKPLPAAAPDSADGPGDGHDDEVQDNESLFESYRLADGTMPDTIPVTDPEHDAPDGATIDGYTRQRDTWVKTAAPVPAGGEDGSGTAAERRTCGHAYVGNVGEFTCDLYAPHDGKHWNSLAEFGWTGEVTA